MTDIDEINAKIAAWRESVDALVAERGEQVLQAMCSVAGQMASNVGRIFKVLARMGQLFSNDYGRYHNHRYHAYIRKRRAGQAWRKTTPYRFRREV